MKDKKPERLCRTCAWGDPHLVHPPKNVVPITCHHEPIPVRNRPDYWCRHWAKTRGWDRFEELDATQVSGIGPNKVTKEDFKLRCKDESLHDIPEVQKWLDTCEQKIADEMAKEDFK